MQDLTNIIQNSGLAKIAKGASGGVLNAIGQASAKTGVDFAYLVQQAQAESNFNPTVKAKTSSATGLFQFIKSTWMDMVDKHGVKHGINTEGMSKQQILDLRKDPEISSNMAAEFASDNEKFLNDHWAKGKKEIGATELYFAHFMGAGGASSFLNARDENPAQPAAVIFPKAAKANYNVFYERGTGRAKSMDEVYAFFDKKFDVKSAPDISLEPSQYASVEATSETSSNKGGLYSNSIQSFVFNDARKTPTTNSNYSSGIPNYQLVQSPVQLMLLGQLDLPGVDPLDGDKSNKKNSLFYNG